jgi:hypothetical protein
MQGRRDRGWRDGRTLRAARRRRPERLRPGRPAGGKAIGQRRDARGKGRDVVLGWPRPQPALRDVIAQARKVGLVGQGPAQPLEAAVQRLAAHLDGSVGDQQHGAAGGERELVLAVAGRLRDPERRVALDLQDARLAARRLDQRREMAGADDAHPLGLEIEDDVRDRGHLAGGERRDQPVEPVHDAGRRVGVERVGAQAGAHLGHQGGGRHPVPHHVADDQPHLAAGQREHVVPVAADAAVQRRRVIARGQLQPGNLREPLGHEPALEYLHNAHLVEQAGVFYGHPGAVGRELEQVAVALGEHPGRE